MAFTISGTTGINLATQPLTGALPDANAPSGSVIQVVNSVKTDTQSTASTSYIDVTSLSVTITPASASNKILVRVCLNNISVDNAGVALFNLVRGSTTLTSSTAGGLADTADAWASGGGGGMATNSRKISSCSLDYLDSPSSTSSLTYKVQMRSESGATTGYINRWAENSDVAAVSSITVMEIVG